MFVGDVLAYDEIERARPTGCFSPEAFQLCPEADAVDLLQVCQKFETKYRMLSKKQILLWS